MLVNDQAWIAPETDPASAADSLDEADAYSADEAPVAPPTRVQRGGWGILGVDAPAYPTTGWGSGTGWGTARAVKRDTEELETEERAKESAKRWRGNEPTGGDEFHQDTEPGSGLN